jgi:nitrogen fixation NifU-like protein
MPASSLYDDVLMEHIRNARNYRVIEAPHERSEVSNPLCGDTFTLYVRVTGDVVEDAAFQCECCGIAMASASIMTEWIRGRRVNEAMNTAAAFRQAIARKVERLDREAHPDHPAVLQVVKANPSRDRCALLGWSALEAALERASAAPGSD